MPELMQGCKYFFESFDLSNQRRRNEYFAEDVRDMCEVLEAAFMKATDFSSRFPLYLYVLCRIRMYTYYLDGHPRVVEYMDELSTRIITSIVRIDITADLAHMLRNGPRTKNLTYLWKEDRTICELALGFLVREEGITDVKLLPLIMLIAFDMKLDAAWRTSLGWEEYVAAFLSDYEIHVDARKFFDTIRAQQDLLEDMPNASAIAMLARNPGFRNADPNVFWEAVRATGDKAYREFLRKYVDTFGSYCKDLSGEKMDCAAKFVASCVPYAGTGLTQSIMKSLLANTGDHMERLALVLSVEQQILSGGCVGCDGCHSCKGCGGCDTPGPCDGCDGCGRCSGCDGCGPNARRLVPLEITGYIQMFSMRATPSIVELTKALDRMPITIAGTLVDSYVANCTQESTKEVYVEKIVPLLECYALWEGRTVERDLAVFERLIGDCQYLTSVKKRRTVRMLFRVMTRVPAFAVCVPLGRLSESYRWKMTIMPIVDFCKMWEEVFEDPLIEWPSNDSIAGEGVRLLWDRYCCDCTKPLGTIQLSLTGDLLKAIEEVSGNMQPHPEYAKCQLSAVARVFSSLCSSMEIDQLLQVPRFVRLIYSLCQNECGDRAVIEKVRGRLLKHRVEIKTGELTKDQYAYVANYAEDYAKLYSAVNERVDVDAAKLAAECEERLSTLEENAIVLSFVVRMGVSEFADLRGNVAAVLEKGTGATLKELRSIVTAVEEFVIAPLSKGKKQDVYKFILHFESQESVLFQGLAESELMSHGERLEFPSSIVKFVTNKRKLFVDLFQGDVNTELLKDLLVRFQQIDVQNEVAKLTAYGDIGHGAMDIKPEDIAQAFKSLQFHSNVAQVLDCIRRYDLLENDDDEDFVYLSKMGTMDHCNLMEVATKYERLNALFKDLDTCHMALFEHAYKAPSLVQWLRDGRFCGKEGSERFDALRQNMNQNLSNREAMQLLDHAINASQVLSVLLKTKAPSLRLLLQDVAGSLYQEAAGRLESIGVANQSISRIKVLFMANSFDDALSTMKLIRTRGLFVVELSVGQGVTTHVEYSLPAAAEGGVPGCTELAVMDDEETEHFLRQLAFSAEESAEVGVDRDRDMLDVSRFLEVHSVMEQQKEVLVALHKRGHPDYQRKDVKQSFNALVQDLRNIMDEYTRELDEWLAIVDSARVDRPLLALWSQKEIASVGHLLTRSRDRAFFIKSNVGEVEWPANEEERTKKEDMYARALIVGYLEALAGHAALKPGVALEDEHLLDSFFDLPCPVQSRNRLEAIGELLDHVFEAPLVFAPDDVGGTQYGICLPSDEMSVIQHVLSPFERKNRLPRAGEILWCSLETSVDDINLMFTRARLLKNLTLVLVNANVLSFETHQALLEEQKRMHEERNAYSDLIYVHIQKQGYAQISGLARLPDASPINRLTQFVRERGPIRNTISATGFGGWGKTHYLSKQLRQREGEIPLVVAINDHLTRTIVLQKLASLKAQLLADTKERASVFFNVSRHAPYIEVSRMFFDLFISRVIRDDATGSLLTIPSSFSFLIEVPFGATKVANPDFLHNLPIVGFISEPYQMRSNEPFDFTEEDLKAVRVMKAYYDFTTSDCYRGNPARHRSIDLLAINEDQPVVLPELQGDAAEYFTRCIQAQAGSLLTYEHGDTIRNTKLHQKCFLRFLATRFTTFESHLYTWNAVVPHMGSMLFDQYCREANRLSQRDFVCSWGAFSEVVLVTGNSDGVSFQAMFKPGSDLQNLRQLVDDSIKDEKIIEEAVASGAQSWGRQEKLLAWALSINKDGPQSIYELLQREKFVLIEDFTYKLIHIHERKKARIALIIEGETGVGKTFLLSFYAKMINLALMRDKEHPDAPNVERKFVTWLLEFIWPDIPAESPEEQTAKQVLKKQLEEEDFRAEDYPDCYTDLWTDLLEKTFPSDIQELFLNQVINWFVDNPILKCTDSIAALVKQKPSKEQSIALVREFLTVGVQNLFYRMLVHPGVTSTQVKEFLKPIVILAWSVKEVEFVVFFDEVNTSAILGFFKEIVVDHMMEGVNLPPNIFIVAAINPLRAKNNGDPADAPEPSLLDAPQVFRDKYFVNKLPDAMEELKWKYPSLDMSTLRGYIAKKIKIIAQETTEGQNMFGLTFLEEIFTAVVVAAQRFYVDHPEGSANFGEASVSQRDIQRVFRLVNYFNKLLDCPEAHAIVSSDNERLLLSILMAVAIAYYFRLPTSNVAGKDGGEGTNLRRLFAQQIDNAGTGGYRSYEESVSKVLNWMVTFDHFLIPSGIALNDALKENIFAIIVCMETRIPLAIIGAPGTSKTQSFRIVLDNLQGENSPMPFCKRFHHIDPWFIQCTQYTTANDIKEVFEKGIARETGVYKYSADRMRTVIFLDEAGLPDEKKMVMKVLHQYLDECQVSVICISNQQFDAANTNRMSIVYRSMAKDLEVLARGCLGLPIERRRGGLALDLQCVIDGLCSGYERLSACGDEAITNFFHDRDWIYTLRMLNRTARAHGRTMTMVITPLLLLHALETNFNGLKEDKFKFIVETFFKEISAHMVQRGLRGWENPALTEYRSTTSVIKSALDEQVVAPGDPVQLRPRFKLILDPSRDDSAARLLFQLHLLQHETTEIFHLSDFEEDKSGIAQAKVISEIRFCMEQGKTVLLVNASRIWGAFYDVFNQNYRSMPNVSKTGDDFQGEVADLLFSYVAVGRRTHTCPIHDDFQCIVHLRLDDLPNTPAPFLSRFEKFRLSLDELTSVQLGRFLPTERDQLDRAFDKCRSFIKHIGAKSFYGLQEENDATLSSIFVSHTHDVVGATTAAAFARFSRLAGESSTDLIACPDFPRSLVRSVCARLIQLLPPEVLMRMRPTMKEYQIYGQLYFDTQEHFSLQSFVNRLLLPECPPHPDFNAVAHKHVCYVRTTGGVLSLKQQQTTVFGEESRVTVEDFGSFGTQDAFKHVVNAFVKNEQKSVFIVVINTRVVPTSHISFVRALIDKAAPKEGGPSKYFITLLHFPPESLLSGRGYPCLMLHGWDYHFFDTLGLRGEGAVLQGLSSLLCSGGTGTGADEIEMSVEEGAVDDVLWRFCMAVAVQPCQHLPAALPEAVRSFYVPEASVQQRLQSLKAVLAKHPALLSHITAEFFAAHSAKGVDRMLREVANGAMLGYAEQVQRHLRREMIYFFGRYLTAIVKEYGLATLHALPADATSTALLSRLLSFVKAPTMEEVKNAPLDPLFSVAVPSPWVSSLPLAHILRQRVEEHLNDITSSNPSASRDQLVSALHEASMSDPDIRNLVADTEPSFFSEYALEFAAREGLRASGDTSTQREIFRAAGEYVLLDLDNDRSKVLAHIHVSARFMVEKLQLLCSGALCLQHLDTEVPRADPTEDDRASYETRFAEHVFDALWKNLKNLSSAEYSQDALLKWAGAYKYIQRYFPSRIFLSDYEMRTMERKSELMAIVFVYLRSPARDLANPSCAAFVAYAIELGEQPGTGTYNLASVVQIVGGLELLEGAESATLASDLINWFMQDASPSVAGKDVNAAFLMKVLNGRCTVVGNLKNEMKMYLFKTLASKLRSSMDIDDARALLTRLSSLVHQELAEAGTLEDGQTLPPYLPAYIADREEGDLTQPLADVWFSYLIKYFEDEPLLQMVLRIASPAISNVLSHAVMKAAATHACLVKAAKTLSSPNVDLQDRMTFRRGDCHQAAKILAQFVHVRQEYQFLFLGTIRAERGSDYLDELLQTEEVVSKCEWLRALAPALRADVPWSSVAFRPSFMLRIDSPEAGGTLTGLQAPYAAFSTLFKECVASGDFAPLTAHIEAEGGVPLEKYRMFLLLQVYHDYYCSNNLVPLAPLVALLEGTLGQALQLHGKELAATLVFVSAERNLLRGQEEDNHVAKEFSPEFDDAVELPLRHTLVNALALAIGTNSEGNENHLRTHAFNPRSLHKTHGFGSIYANPIDGVHYDCGCELTQNGQHARALQANREFPMSLATTYAAHLLSYGMFSLNVLFDRDAETNLCGPILTPSKINYTASPAGIMAGNTQLKKMCHFISARYRLSFFSLQACGDHLSPDECGMFLTRMVERFFSLAGDNVNKSVFTTVQESISAETFFQTEVTRKTMSELPATMAAVQQASSVRAQLDAFWANVPMTVTYSHFTEALNFARQTHGPSLALLDLFVTSRDKFLLLRMVPPLVEFYTLIHRDVSGTIKEEDAPHVTLEASLEGVTTRNPHDLLNIVDAGLRAFNNYHAATGGMIKPGACDDASAFEILDVDDSLLRIISLRETDGQDLLFRVIDGIMSTFADFLHEVELIFSGLPENDPLKVRAQAFLMQTSVPLHQLVSSRSGVLAPDFTDVFEELAVAHFQCASLVRGIDLKFDMEKVLELTVLEYVLGCSMIDTQRIRTTFSFERAPAEVVDREGRELPIPAEFQGNLEEDQSRAVGRFIGELRQDEILAAIEDAEAFASHVRVMSNEDRAELPERPLRASLETLGLDQGVLGQVAGAGSLLAKHAVCIHALLAEKLDSLEGVFANLPPNLRDTMSEELHNTTFLKLEIFLGERPDSALGLVDKTLEYLGEEATETMALYLRDEAMAVVFDCLGIEDDIINKWLIPGSCDVIEEDTEIKASHFMALAVLLLRKRNSLLEDADRKAQATKWTDGGDDKGEVVHNTEGINDEEDNWHTFFDDDDDDDNDDDDNNTEQPSPLVPTYDDDDRYDEESDARDGDDDGMFTKKAAAPMGVPVRTMYEMEGSVVPEGVVMDLTDAFDALANGTEVVTGEQLVELAGKGLKIDKRELFGGAEVVAEKMKEDFGEDYLTFQFAFADVLHYAGWEEVQFGWDVPSPGLEDNDPPAFDTPSDIDEFEAPDDSARSTEHPDDFIADCAVGAVDWRITNVSDLDGVDETPAPLQIPEKNNKYAMIHVEYQDATPLKVIYTKSANPYKKGRMSKIEAKAKKDWDGVSLSSCVFMDEHLCVLEQLCKNGDGLCVPPVLVLADEKDIVVVFVRRNDGEVTRLRFHNSLTVGEAAGRAAARVIGAEAATMRYVVQQKDSIVDPTLPIASAAGDEDSPLLLLCPDEILRVTLNENTVYLPCDATNGEVLRALADDESNLIFWGISDDEGIFTKTASEELFVVNQNRLVDVTIKMMANTWDVSVPPSSPASSCVSAALVQFGLPPPPAYVLQVEGCKTSLDPSEEVSAHLEEGTSKLVLVVRPRLDVMHKELCLEHGVEEGQTVGDVLDLLASDSSDLVLINEGTKQAYAPSTVVTADMCCYSCIAVADTEVLEIPVTCTCGRETKLRFLNSATSQHLQAAIVSECLSGNSSHEHPAKGADVTLDGWVLPASFHLGVLPRAKYLLSSQSNDDDPDSGEESSDDTYAYTPAGLTLQPPGTERFVVQVQVEDVEDHTLVFSAEKEARLDTLKHILVGIHLTTEEAIESILLEDCVCEEDMSLEDVAEMDEDYADNTLKLTVQWNRTLAEVPVCIGEQEPQLIYCALSTPLPQVLKLGRLMLDCAPGMSLGPNLHCDEGTLEDLMELMEEDGLYLVFTQEE